MRKIRLTESRLLDLIRESVMRVLNEGDDFDVLGYFCDNFYEECPTPEHQVKWMKAFLTYLAKNDEPDYKAIINTLAEYRKRVEEELQLPENGGGKYTFDDYVGIHTKSKILDTVQVFLEDYKLMDLFKDVAGSGSFNKAIYDYMWS